jgi:mannose-6-phosphate isomerase-like protein (cupin superfamily)
MITRTHYDDVEPFITKDGSLIRELMHPTLHGNRTQSLAEATVPIGGMTLLHTHRISEELYHITHGSGVMVLGDEHIDVSAGDTVFIPPGIPHRIENTGDSAFILLCGCSPSYAHDDTDLVE